jgi:hypothetical protein
VLAKEKKRSAWSLAIGAPLALALFGWCHWNALQADARVRQLVVKCGTEPVAPLTDRDFAPDPPKGYKLDSLAGAKPVCEPSDLEGEPELTGIGSPIVEAVTRAQRLHDNALLWSLILFAGFCTPLLWYFLIDRLREISAAISGRDHQE